MRWAPEEDTRLLELLEQGLSRYQIGEVLGRTRGSVEGRANRIKQRDEGPPVPKKARSTARELTSRLLHKFEPRRLQCSPCWLR